MLKSVVVASRLLRSNLVRSAASLSPIDIEIEMRRLNRQRQYSDVLNLYDQTKMHEKPNDRIIVQALNACAQSKSFELGQRIHNQLDQRSLNNDYIRSTLINLYSLCPIEHLLMLIRFLSVILVQCHDVKVAERIFASTKKESIVLYGAMMKG